MSAISSIASTSLSACVVGGLSAGMGSSLLLSHISFTRAAIIGGSSVAATVASFVTLTCGVAYYESIHERETAKSIASWQWAALVVPPLVVLCAANVSATTGIVLIASAIAGLALKSITVGVFPDP